MAIFGFLFFFICSAKTEAKAIELTLVATLSDLLVRITGALVPDYIAPFKKCAV